MNRCAKCHQPSDLMLCNDCTTALRIELGDVPALLADLDITRSRQDQLVARYGNGPSGSENPLPFKVHVAEVVWVLHHTLYSWVTTLDGGEPAPRGRFPFAIPTSGALSRYLLSRIHRIRVRVDAAQLADEITSAIHQARHAIDRPNDQRAFLGPCGAQLPDATTCRHEVYGVAGKPAIRCPACGAVHNVAERQSWLLDIAQDRLGSTTEIAGFLRTAGVQCTPSMIRNYVARGRLAPAPDTDPPLYRMRDVLAAIQDRYQRKPRRDAS
jgi:hypothetical protein